MHAWRISCFSVTAKSLIYGPSVSGLSDSGPSGQMFLGPLDLNFQLENIFFPVSVTSWAFIYFFENEPPV